MSIHSRFLPASHSQLAIWHQSDGSGVCFSGPWLTHWLKIFLKGIPERMPTPGTKWACPTPGAEEGCLYALIGQRHHSLNPHRPGTRGPRWSSLLTNANTSTIYPANVNQRHSSGRASKSLIGFKDHVWKNTVGSSPWVLAVVVPSGEKSKEQESVVLGIYFCNGIWYWLQIAWIKGGFEVISYITDFVWFWQEKKFLNYTLLTQIGAHTMLWKKLNCLTCKLLLLFCYSGYKIHGYVLFWWYFVPPWKIYFSFKYFFLFSYINIYETLCCW